MRKTYIYRITIPYGKDACYIGSTVSPSSRKEQHLRMLNKGNHHSIKLQRAFSKYKKVMLFEIIEECTQQERNEREQFWIDHYDSMGSGYNMVIVDKIFAYTIEQRNYQRIEKLDRYQELEDKMLTLLSKYKGVVSPSYCSLFGREITKFSIPDYVSKVEVNDCMFIDEIITGLDSFENMLKEWLTMCDPVNMKFVTDNERYIDSSCCYVGNGTGVDRRFSKLKAEFKNYYTKDVCSIIRLSLGLYNSNSLLSRIMENLTDHGYDFIDQTPITRNSCKEGLFPITKEYMNKKEITLL